MYPFGLLLVRHGVSALMRSKMGALTLGMLDYTSSLSLLIELLCATPMFYCLMMQASPADFISSSLINAALEVVGAAIHARANRALSQSGIQNDLSKFVSARVRSPGVNAPPSQVVPSTAKGQDEPALEGAGAAAVHGGEAVAPRPEDLLASVTAHRNLGEMTALFCGSGLAILESRDSPSSLAAKASVLLALECVTDHVKARLLSASGVPVHLVSFHLHWPVLAAVAGTGAASLLCLRTAVRLNCSYGHAQGEAGADPW